MKITVVGSGYVGLVTGICFAETGNDVICVDIDQRKIEMLRQGKLPIYEPGLEILFERNLAQGRIQFTTSLSDGIEDSEIIFLALPTPPGEDGSADLKYVLKVAEDLGIIMRSYKVIVDKSTVPVGTALRVHAAIAANAEVEFDVVSNPEFLREGVAVEDFMKPDRVVIGTSSERARKIMEQLYKPFVRQGNPIIFMDEKSAEMTKYAANSFLATKISFMNEIANLCEKVGANVDMVRIGIGSDNRIGKRFLFPGIGYGGSCFPKDVQALAKTANEFDSPLQIVNAVMQVNETQKTILFPKINEFFECDLKDKKIAVWGLSFKPNTDDIREAPSLYMIDKLLESGATVAAYDPEAINNVRQVYHDKIQYGNDMYQILENADALLIVTEWSTFRNPDFNKIKSLLKQPVIFDGRNLFEIEQMEELDFHYESIGRKAVVKKNKYDLSEEA
jgi:UDPglucose 6-dehydrogenase